MATTNIINITTGFYTQKRFYGLVNQGFLCFGNLFLSRFCGCKLLLCLVENYILVKGIQKLFCNLPRTDSNRFCKLFFLARCHLTIQTNDTVCKRGKRVLALISESHVHHQFSHTDRWFALKCTGIRFFGFCNTNSIDDNEMIFVIGGIGRNLLEIVFGEGSRSATFHLLKIVFTTHVAHKDQALDRLDISSGCNHINGNGNARIIIVSKGT